MADNKGVLIIGGDAILKGEIRNCREMHVHGYAEGSLEAGRVVVHPEGRLFGNVKAETADVHGEFKGNARVAQLMSVKSTGNVSGNVKYGRLSIEEGGELSAHMRNVPPSLMGDLDITVNKGASVRITTADLSAVDPDDTAQNLTFSVSNLANGHIVFSGAPGEPITVFTQHDLEQGRVHFKHDGSAAQTARFDVVVADGSGASSGPPQTVNVAVRA